MNSTDKTKIIRTIIRLPKEVHQFKDISTYDLLSRSGYFESFKIISESDIETELTSQPEYVETWLNWSSDKRTSSGWYFKEVKSNAYLVGYYPSGKFPIKQYVDKIKACSVFIKEEIELLRKI